MKRTILVNKFIAFVMTLLLFLAGCSPGEEVNEYLSITTRNMLMEQIPMMV